MFSVSPQWWFPSGANRELHWAAWEQAVGSSYVIFAAVVLLAAACWPRPQLDKRGPRARLASPGFAGQACRIARNAVGGDASGPAW